VVRRRAALPGLLLAALLLAGPARAQPVPPPPPPPPPPPAAPQKSAAEILYEEAWAAMDARDYQTACAKFAASYEVSGATGPLQGLARCEEGLGHLARALEHWRTLVARLPPSSPTKPEAEASVKRLEGKVGRLRLQLERGAPQGTRVSVDGTAVRADGRELPIDPDVDHEVRAGAEGLRDRVYKVRVRGGEAKALTVAPLGTEAPAPAATDVGDGSSLRTAGLVAGGIGLASAAVAVVTGVVMLGAESDVDEACGDRARCADPVAAAEAGERGDDLAVLNGITFATAVVGIGAGVTLFVLGSSAKGGPPATTGWTLRVGPAGGTLRARF
jgi:hypothetical protein